MNGKLEMKNSNTDQHHRLRIAVLFGGRSGEHEVSLDSARSVLHELDPRKYEIFQVGITHDGTWLTGPNVHQAFVKGETGNLLPCTILPDASQPGLFAIQEETLKLLTSLDVVFPVLHGTYGEDGTLQGLLEMADLAYVGAGVTSSAVGMDKGIFKEIMRSVGIPTVKSIIVLRSQIEHEIENVILMAEKVAQYPLFIKPANLGSSVGITKCNSRADLGEGLKEASLYDRRILVERGLDAREIEVAVLGNDEPQASIPGEVLPSREFYSYEAKYVDGTSGLLIPAPLSSEMAEKISESAIRAYKAIDCSGMARVDFFLEKNPHGKGDIDSEIYINEVNTIPGFTSISMYPKLWDASGLPYAKLLDRLVQLAMERKSDQNRTIRRFRRTS